MADDKHPHDHFFKAVFTKRQVILDYIRQFLPKELWKNLDLRTLKLSRTSFVDEKLQENISDLVYTCVWKGKERVRICLLLEHKSYPVKYPHVQLLRYMVNIWEADIKATKKIRLVIPVVFYHGKTEWKKKPLESYFGEVGEVFQQFIPKFDYFLTDLSQYPDKFIVNLKRGFLINSVLVMKHAREEAYLLENVDRIFIYEEQFLENEEGAIMLQQILTYIVQTNDMKEETFKIFSESLNKKIQKMANTTYDHILQKGKEIGKEIGLEEGKEIGLEEGKEIVIKNIIKNSPDLKDAYIAKLTEVSVKQVKAIRAKIVN